MPQVDQFLAEISHSSGISINQLIEAGWQAEVIRAAKEGRLDDLKRNFEGCLASITQQKMRLGFDLLSLGFVMICHDGEVQAKKTACKIHLTYGIHLDHTIQVISDIILHRDGELSVAPVCGLPVRYLKATDEAGVTLLKEATRAELWERSGSFITELSTLLGEGAGDLLKQTGHLRFAREMCLSVCPREAAQHVGDLLKVIGQLSYVYRIEKLSSLRFELSKNSPIMAVAGNFSLHMQPEIYYEVAKAGIPVTTDQHMKVSIDSTGEASVAADDGSLRISFGDCRSERGLSLIRSVLTPANPGVIPFLDEVAKATGISGHELVQAGFASESQKWMSQQINPTQIVNMILDLQALVEDQNRHGVDLRGNGFEIVADKSEKVVLRKRCIAVQVPTASRNFDIDDDGTVDVEFLANGWLQIFDGDDCVLYKDWKSGGEGGKIRTEALGHSREANKG